VRRLHEELLTGDLGAVDRLFSADFVSHNMPPGFPQGVEGVKRFFGLFRDALTDIEVEIDEILVDGDRAAVATTTRGAHTGELLGVRPTGRRLEIGGIDLVRVDEDGRIAEHRGLTDSVGLLRQLS
jgi:predicted ester cyclase